MSLTPKQKAFVQHYLACGLNATEAAKRAGYSPKTAHSAGPRLLGDVEVQKAIQEAQAKVAQRASMKADDIRARLEEIAQKDPEADEDQDDEGAVPRRRRPNAVRYEHVLKALEMLARMQGLFATKVELSGAGGEPLQIIVQKIGEDAQ